MSRCFFFFFFYFHIKEVHSLNIPSPIIWNWCIHGSLKCDLFSTMLVLYLSGPFLLPNMTFFTKGRKIKMTKKENVVSKLLAHQITFCISYWMTVCHPATMMNCQIQTHSGGIQNWYYKWIRVATTHLFSCWKKWINNSICFQRNQS